VFLKLIPYLVKHKVFINKKEGAKHLNLTTITIKKNIKMEKDLNYWKKNAEEDYMKVPISVLRYITELEKSVLVGAISANSKCKHDFRTFYKVGWNGRLKVKNVKCIYCNKKE
jgi:hypothetical protein